MQGAGASWLKTLWLYTTILCSRILQVYRHTPHTFPSLALVMKSGRINPLYNLLQADFFLFLPQSRDMTT